MNQYAKAALKAVELCNGTNPVESWEKAAQEIIKSESGRKKTCPRSTFLGMCEAGLINDIEANTYLTRPSRNKDYAIKAINLLKENPDLKDDKAKLWRLCTDSDRKPNEKIEVILTLYDNGFIK